jgi:phosphomethylpyrimidine synthase
MDTEDARKCAAEEGLAEEAALRQGLEAKAKEFVDPGSEVYSQA